MAKKQFKAESQRLLDLMINSIYTHKEIFLREIISNASDAVDKLCYLSLTDDKVGLSRGDFAITLAPDKENRQLVISDNGVGMTREELETNLGTIAKSGSLQFKKDMKEGETQTGADVDIIGQFGVGFYSAFMVSDQVTVISRAYGSEEAFKWESSGVDGYTISPCEKDTVGTQIIMKIKEDTDDENYSQYLEEYTLVDLVKKYSDYIRYPIKMEREKHRPKEGGEEGESETYSEVETLNSMIPIWQRSRSEVTQEDYNTFYREKFFDFEEPLKAIHMDAEGLVSYKALLFIPAKASYDYYTKEYKKGLQLYSSGVLITDKCEELVPEHFRFIRGVVDSPDLSLNLSREMLQHTRQLKTIATSLEKKVKNELLKLLSDDREKYETFYKSFGLQLKYGITAGFGMNKDMLADLLLFYSSTEQKLVTLGEYISRMKEDQKNIYYATGETIQKIAGLPQLEPIREKGYEILYFTDEVDEFAVQAMRDYKEKPFRSGNSEDPELVTEEEKKQAEKQSEDNKSLLEFAKEALGDRVQDVKISHKLRSHPVCLTAEGPLSFEMEKYLNTVQPDSDTKAQRVLELNPGHEVFAALQTLYTGNPEQAKKYVEVLYHQAVLMAGLPLEDPAAYSDIVFGLLK
ncbi:molecular chaperone HtpG [Oscillospiraceae bacterium MB08-C2-2]|nr:molecular chaperone HtpG [Oscillospiraceae bacterium MB08-C2-2]